VAQAQPGPAGPRAAVDQAKVDQAIDRGVRYLKDCQLQSGTWGMHENTYQVGYAALPGLALLECGVPAWDPIVKKAVQFVRANAEELDRTYDLALAILLLDKIGNADDDEIIQKLA